MIAFCEVRYLIKKAFIIKDNFQELYSYLINFIAEIKG